MQGPEVRSVPRRRHPEPMPDPGACSGWLGTSTYQDEFGQYGTNPRDKVDPGATSLPVFKTALSRGTTKGTYHVPGYQGFIAANTSNLHVARAELAATPRAYVKEDRA